MQPLFSPTAFTAEALASAAVAVAFPSDRRLAFERDVLFPLGGLERASAARYLRVSALVQELEPGIASIARQYLEGDATSADAAIWLEREVLMAHGAGALRFVNLYRGYALAYTFGSGLLDSGSGGSGGEGLRPSGQWKRFLEVMLAPFPSLQLPPAARAVS